MLSGVPDVQLYIGDNQAAAGVTTGRSQPPEERKKGETQEGKRFVFIQRSVLT